MDHIVAFLSILLISVVNIRHAVAADDVMEISRFSVDSSLVSAGSSFVMRCRVASMDTSKFVRYTKHVPGAAEPFVLTTNINKEESIKEIDRYSIAAEENEDNGYDFVLRIEDVRVEDSGNYSCSIPQFNSIRYLQVNVIVSPTSLELYVDDHRISTIGEEIKFDEIAHRNITCVAGGGNPAPVITFKSGDSALTSSSMTSACQYETDQPGLFANFSCATTATIYQHRISYVDSRRPITCTARSRGSPVVRLSNHFVPTFDGGPPRMTCDRSAAAKLYQRNFQLACRVTADPPLTTAYIHWNPNGRLRPTRRRGWPDGLLFDRDDEYMAYLRQGENATTLELELERVFPQMFRDYHFVAVNEFGSVERVTTLWRNVGPGEVRSSASHSRLNLFTLLISLLIVFRFCSRVPLPIQNSFRTA